MNKIKNIMKSKVTMVVLACLLLVGVFAGISAIAGEGQPVVKIVATNLSHDATPTIMYEVQISGLTEAPDPAAVEMKFWNSENFDVYKEADDVATYADKRVELIDYADGVATLYCYSKGFAPKQMTDTIYATATYADKYSAVVNYSVFQYLCEANMNGGTTEQTALWDAMERYITYAQQYLGWDKSTTPDQLGYYKAVNAYITLSEDGTEKYTAGTFKAGTYIYIWPDLPEDKEFGAIVNADGQAMTLLTTEDGTKYYGCGVVAGVSRTYTALPATTITFTGEGTLVQVAKGTATGGTQPVYTPIKRLATGENMTAVNTDTRAFVLTAAATATDENGAVMTFSYWEDGAGNKISEDLTYFCDELIDFTKEEVTIAARPVYAAPEVTYDIGANAANGSYPAGASYTKLENGFTIDLTNKTASPTLKVDSVGQNVSGSLDSIVYTMTINIPNIGNNLVEDHIKPFGTYGGYGNVRFFKNALRLGTKNVVQFSLFGNGSGQKNPFNGYYLSIDTDKNDSNYYQFKDADAIMQFGQDYELTFDLQLNQSGTSYTASSISVYVGDTYIGTVNDLQLKAAANGGIATAGYSANTQARSWTILTMTDIKAYANLK